MNEAIVTDPEMHQIKILQEYGLSDGEIAKIFYCKTAKEFEEIFIRTEAVNEGISKSLKTTNEVAKTSNDAQATA